MNCISHAVVGTVAACKTTNQKNGNIRSRRAPSVRGRVIHAALR